MAELLVYLLGLVLLVLSCSLAVPLDTPVAVLTELPPPPGLPPRPTSTSTPGSTPGAAVEPGLGGELHSDVLIPPAQPLGTPTPATAAEHSLQQPPDELLVFGKNHSLAAHMDAAYLQSLYWDFNGTFHLSKFEDFDHTAFDDSNEIKATTVAPSWLPKGPDKSKALKQLPEFDSNLVTNVTAQLGETAFLPCRVRNLGEHRVLWVRRRDWHILTSGTSTYTTDERFTVGHTDGGEDWHLHIKYVQKRDNGTYECQVATGQGKISHFFNLHVVVPTAYILGTGEYHIGEGSTISLVCIIENSPTPPQYVMWYHNGRMINYDVHRGGVTVSTEPGLKTHSRLIVNSAKLSDSGNYTCQASNTENDTIYVSVSNEGDNTAAIQGQEASYTSRIAGLPLPLSLLCACIACLCALRSV